MDISEVNLFDLDLPIGSFRFDHYIEGEWYILTPALIEAGLFPMGTWSSVEGDEFGPIVRSITVIDLEGTIQHVWYSPRIFSKP